MRRRRGSSRRHTTTTGHAGDGSDVPKALLRLCRRLTLALDVGEVLVDAALPDVEREGEAPAEAQQRFGDVAAVAGVQGIAVVVVWRLDDPRLLRGMAGRTSLRTLSAVVRAESRGRRPSRRSIVCPSSRPHGTPGRPQGRRSAERRRQLRRRRGVALVVLVVLLALIVWRVAACGCGGAGGTDVTLRPRAASSAPVADRRRRQGRHLPRRLLAPLLRPRPRCPAPRRAVEDAARQRLDVGQVRSTTRRPSGPAAAGPGMPSIVVDGGRPYVLVGGYDHRLRRIDAETGEVVWEYKYDDIIKSSPSRVREPAPDRRGRQVRRLRRVAARLSLASSPTRAWRRTGPSPSAAARSSGDCRCRRPACYSRDCDGSGFFLDGRQYIGVESGWFYALDPLHDRGLERATRSRRSSPSACCSATSAPSRTRATSCWSRRPRCSASASTSPPGPATCTACAAATWPWSGTTSSARTWTARPCPRAAASCWWRSRSSTSRATAASCASTRPSRRSRRRSGSSRPATARWASGAAALIGSVRRQRRVQPRRQPARRWRRSTPSTATCTSSRRTP